MDHLRTWGCLVYVPIPPKKHTSKLAQQRTTAIYVGFESRHIILALCPDTGSLGRFRFDDCKFAETTFPKLTDTHDTYTWDIDSKFHDPITSALNDELYKTLNLWQTANLHPHRFVIHPDVSKATQQANTQLLKSDEVEGEEEAKLLATLNNKMVILSSQQTQILEPNTILEAQNTEHWPDWKKATQDEIDSLIQRGTFSEPVNPPLNRTIVGS